MSRIGKKPIAVPEGVGVEVKKNNIMIKGQKGKLELDFRPEMKVSFDKEKKIIKVNRTQNTAMQKSLHGLTRTLIYNMVKGVVDGYEKSLEIVGKQYNVKLQGQELVIEIGFCDPVKIKAPEGIDVEVPNPTRIIVRGCDKQKVGQFAAEIRAIRPPEPYKGKGIRYEGEYVRKKAGKTFVAAE